MKKNNYNLKFGKFGEGIAAKYLVNKGFELVSQNYNCVAGEIDIIAFKDDLLIIVEVKTRSKIDSEETLLSVTKAKQRKISRATADFIEKNQQYAEYIIRFDIITVVKHPYREEYTVDHYDNAFCYLF